MYIVSNKKFTKSMKTKMGRPKLPKGTANNVVFSVKISPLEYNEITHAIRRDGLKKPEWARSALLGATASGTIVLRLRCPNCGNEVRKLPRQLKTGGATICPKCGRTFIDEAVLKEAETLAKLLEL
jgi:ssDNA-binding Zn-finger/Zn-ribbon topoisomerase 1